MKKIILALILTAVLFFLFNNILGEVIVKENFLAFMLKNGNYLFNLINKENTILQYAPNDLVELYSLNAPGKYIRFPVFLDLALLMDKAYRDGAPLKIISAYRSYETQKGLFAFYKKRDENAARFSAEAGHSEHQMGAAIDFGTGDSYIDLTAAFAKTKQGKWLEENAWKFGFALSYPEGKEEITGYQYEPWHYRFIGREAAKEWRDSGLILQEFLSQKKQDYF
ncbi:MAG: M15 family metallopeptidase [bacterium]